VESPRHGRGGPIDTPPRDRDRKIQRRPHRAERGGRRRPRRLAESLVHSRGLTRGEPTYSRRRSDRQDRKPHTTQVHSDSLTDSSPIQRSQALLVMKSTAPKSPRPLVRRTSGEPVKTVGRAVARRDSRPAIPGEDHDQPIKRPDRTHRRTTAVGVRRSPTSRSEWTPWPPGLSATDDRPSMKEQSGDRGWPHGGATAFGTQAATRSRGVAMPGRTRKQGSPSGSGLPSVSPRARPPTPAGRVRRRTACVPRNASMHGTAGEIPRSERSGSRQRRPVRDAAASREAAVRRYRCVSIFAAQRRLDLGLRSA